MSKFVRPGDYCEEAETKREIKADSQASDLAEG
jgi:hypothetical protein